MYNQCELCGAIKRDREIKTVENEEVCEDCRWNQLGYFVWNIFKNGSTADKYIHLKERIEKEIERLKL